MSKLNNIERRLSKSGTVSIPKSVRRNLGIQDREKVSIKVNDDASLTIERIEGTCIFCGNTKNVKAYKGKFICDKCIEAVGGIK